MGNKKGVFFAKSCGFVCFFVVSVHVLDVRLRLLVWLVLKVLASPPFWLVVYPQEAYKWKRR